jgi:hypothetical protein
MLVLLFLAVVVCCEVGLSLAMHCYANKLRNVSLCLKGCFSVLALLIILQVAEQQCAGRGTIALVSPCGTFTVPCLCSCCVFVAGDRHASILLVSFVFHGYLTGLNGSSIYSTQQRK